MSELTEGPAVTFYTRQDTCLEAVQEKVNGKEKCTGQFKMQE